MFNVSLGNTPLQDNIILMQDMRPGEIAEIVSGPSGTSHAAGHIVLCIGNDVKPELFASSKPGNVPNKVIYDLTMAHKHADGNYWDGASPGGGLKVRLLRAGETVTLSVAARVQGW